MKICQDQKKTANLERFLSQSVMFDKNKEPPAYKT